MKDRLNQTRNKGGCGIKIIEWLSFPLIFHLFISKLLSCLRYECVQHSLPLEDATNH